MLTVDKACRKGTGGRVEIDGKQIGIYCLGPMIPSLRPNILGLNKYTIYTCHLFTF